MVCPRCGRVWPVLAASVTAPGGNGTIWERGSDLKPHMAPPYHTASATARKDSTTDTCFALDLWRYATVGAHLHFVRLLILRSSIPNPTQNLTPKNPKVKGHGLPVGIYRKIVKKNAMVYIPAIQWLILHNSSAEEPAP